MSEPPTPEPGGKREGRFGCCFCHMMARDPDTAASVVIEGRPYCCEACAGHGEALLAKRTEPTPRVLEAAELLATMQPVSVSRLATTIQKQVDAALKERAMCGACGHEHYIAVLHCKGPNEHPYYCSCEKREREGR